MHEIQPPRYLRVNINGSIHRLKTEFADTWAEHDYDGDTVFILYRIDSTFVLLDTREAVEVYPAEVISDETAVDWLMSQDKKVPDDLVDIENALLSHPHQLAKLQKPDAKVNLSGLPIAWESAEFPVRDFVIAPDPIDGKEQYFDLGSAKPVLAKRFWLQTGYSDTKKECRVEVYALNDGGYLRLYEDATFVNCVEDSATKLTQARVTAIDVLREFQTHKMVAPIEIVQQATSGVSSLAKPNEETAEETSLPSPEVSPQSAEEASPSSNARKKGKTSEEYNSEFIRIFFEKPSLGIREYIALLGCGNKTFYNLPAYQRVKESLIKGRGGKEIPFDPAILDTVADTEDDEVQAKLTSEARQDRRSNTEEARREIRESS